MNSSIPPPDRVLPRLLAAWPLVAVALAGTLNATPLRAQNTPAVRADLQVLSTQRIFLGHQSVGDNLLDGVRQLARDAQVPLTVTEFDSAAQIDAPVLGHTHVAENTQPLKKLKSFEQAMGAQSAKLDLAMLKFCYIDFQAGTDVKQLFGEYQRTVDRIRTAHPKLKLLHITTPLTTVQSGWKVSLKKLVGKAPYGLLENLKREEYNQLLRQTYGPLGSVFDLARTEATQPDGRLWTQHWNGVDVPSLYPPYSDDGEHLNATGQVHVATEFLRVAARQVGKP